MVSSNFDKGKYDALNEVYEKTLGKITPNIFTYTQFLNDSGFERWSPTYTEMLLYYFDTKELFKGISLVFCDDYSNLYGISFTEKFATNIFNATKKHVDYIDEDFLESIPTLKKVGYLNVMYPHFYKYFIEKYKEETGEVVLVAGFSEEWFNPPPPLDDDYFIMGEEAELVPEPDVIIDDGPQVDNRVFLDNYVWFS